MNSLVDVLALIALLGCAIIGGVFFAFSSFVMKALGDLPSPAGIAAMQSINVVVINPSFIGTFIGTAVLSILVLVLVLMSGNGPSALLFAGGAIAYFVGTFLVTMFGNVPLNNRLAAESPEGPEAAATWTHYLDVWTKWNTVRTIAALVAVLLYVFGLMRAA